MLEQLEQVRGRFRLPEPPLPVPAIDAFGGEAPDVVAEALRWHVGAGEELLTIATARRHSGFLGDPLFVAVTGQRLLFAEASDLKSRGEFDQAVPLDDIRYVRVSDKAKDADDKKAHQRLDIVTPDRDVQPVFDKGVAQEQQEAVERVIQLIRSRMRLPADEVPASPLGAPFEGRGGGR